MTLTERIRRTTLDLRLFIAASFAVGAAYSMFDSVFNNYLNETFSPTGFQRSFLEFPRELPGFLVVFVTALLWFLGGRKLSATAMLFGSAGALLIGFASPHYTAMVAWLFIYSLGSHLFMPLSASIGMQLANSGQAGRRLGQLNGVRNLATICGSFLVFAGFRYLGLTFRYTFVLAAVVLAAAAVLLLLMKPEAPAPRPAYLKLHPEYRLYYLLAVLSGSRKQIFITFAPWVLVTVFQQPTQILATLLTIGGVIGILFQPFLGWAIDRFGERPVLVSEGVALVFICTGYGYARDVLPEGTAFLVVCACYLLDQMVFSVSMARSTFMKKLARAPEDVQPALAAGVTIDHVFSISAALMGGVLWNRFGYQSVFLLGMVIAVLNILASLQVRVPAAELPLPVAVQASDSFPLTTKGRGAGGEEVARQP